MKEACKAGQWRCWRVRLLFLPENEVPSMVLPSVGEGEQVAADGDPLGCCWGRYRIPILPGELLVTHSNRILSVSVVVAWEHTSVQ